MKSRLERFYLKNLNEFIYYVKNNNLSVDEIYSLLASFGIEKEQFLLSINTYKECACNGVIDDLKSGRCRCQSYIVQDQDEQFRYVNVTFDKSLNKGSRGLIKLYIPIKYQDMMRSIPLIYQFLLESQINFHSKTSVFVRSDLFCLRVYSIDDAKKVIEFCKNAKFISDNYGYTNPFLAHVDGVGVARDTYQVSYNRWVAQILSMYCMNTANKKVDKRNLSKDFENYVASIYSSMDSSKRRFLVNVLYQNLHAINEGNNIFDYMHDKFDYQFDYNLFYSYKRRYNNNRYEYVDFNGNVINDDNNPLYIRLQALNCISKIYKEKKKNAIDKSFIINENIINEISSEIDGFLDGGRNMNIVSNYQDYRINELLPYLYADVAVGYKQVDMMEVSLVLANARCNLKITTNVNTNSNNNSYFINGDTVLSSVPTVSTSNGVLFIQFLDNDLYNFTLARNGNNITLNNLFFYIDRERLIADLNYRVNIANQIIDAYFSDYIQSFKAK